MENPFIKYWLWYYDVLWHYWQIVLVLVVVALWLMHRRFEKRQREWEAYMNTWPRSDTKPKRARKKPIRQQIEDGDTVPKWVRKKPILQQIEEGDTVQIDKLTDAKSLLNELRQKSAEIDKLKQKSAEIDDLSKK